MTLDWYFRARRGELVCPSPDPDLDLDDGGSKVRDRTVRSRCIACGSSAALTPSARPQMSTLRDQLQRGEGRVEFAELPHQYLQLAPLVGTTNGVESGLHEGDNLATA